MHLFDYSIYYLSSQAPSSKTKWFVSLLERVVQQCATLSGDSDQWVLITGSWEVNASMQQLSEYVCKAIRSSERVQTSSTQ